ncbi:YhgE/Pip domain-containing protein, partial [Paenibacillus sp. MMS18-CY102]|uniref:YhgE/Pip domain-containing protein n=1 Tax=Paenibacillus sp. MMS18-CY102 TaxID=2682849 RepID=UPI0013656E97
MMQGIRLFGQELLDIVRNKKVLISVIGILFIPIMYSGMLVGAFWDPYGKTSNLPIAVVNEDQGAVLDGKQLAIGNDLIKKLEDNDKFKWAFVNKVQAEQGLKDGNYYMALEIPSDFSKQATTLLDANPKPSQLVYVTNESLSFAAAKIGVTAVQELKSTVSKEVTKSYAETVFEQFGKAADGFADASEGASKLHDGASKAKDGVATLQQNLAKLADGTLGLESGVSKLSDGTAKVSAGASALSKSASSLSDGLSKLGAASGQLKDGATKVKEAGAQLAAGTASAKAAEAKLAAGAAQLAAGLDGYAAAASPDAAQDEALQKLIAAAKALATGADQLAAGGDKLAAGASELQQGQSALLQGLAAFDAKLEGAADGGAKLAAGAKALAAGAQQAAQGAGSAFAESNVLKTRHETAKNSIG